MLAKNKLAKNKMKIKNKKLIVTFIICIAILTATVIHKTFENDTFFTIPTGNYIIHNGVNDAEPFTWHQNLKFTKLRWGFDVVVATIYNIAGFGGVYAFTIFMSVLIGVTLFITLVKRKNNPIVALLVSVFTVMCLKTCLKCRGQIMSYLFFIIEIYSIQMLLETGKKKYSAYLIAVSLLILMFHSSVWLAHFIFYAPYILEWAITKIKKFDLFEENSKIEIVQRDTKTMKLLFITMGIALLTGFCTPLGLSPFTYMFKVIGGFSSKIILELQKLNITRNTSLMIILCGILGILSISRTKIKLTDICLIVGLTIMSRMAVRNLYIALGVLAFPLASVLTAYIDTFNKTELMERLAEKLNKNVFALIVMVMLSTLLSIHNYRNIIKEPFVDENTYPVQASEYIKNNIDMEKMRLYNHFNFGSYLEFQGIPTFMDSRSEVYCEEFNNVTILKDFSSFDLDLTMTADQMVEKYGITHFIFMKGNANATNMKSNEKYNLIYDDGKFVIFEVAGWNA